MGILVISYLMPMAQVVIIYLNAASLFLFRGIWEAEIWANLFISAGVLILFYRSKKIGYSILFGLLAVFFLLPFFMYLVEKGVYWFTDGYESIGAIPYFLVDITDGLLTVGTIMVVEFFKNKHQHRVIKPLKLSDPILFSSLGLVVVLVIFVFATYQFAQGEDAIFIVPKGYAGYTVIIYDQEHGEPIRYAGKKRVYAIPPDGILKTQFLNNPGWAAYPEFYYGSIAPENRIPYISNPREIPGDGSVVACGGSTGNYNKDPQGGGETVEFTRYYVGTSKQIRKAYGEAEKLIQTRPD